MTIELFWVPKLSRSTEGLRSDRQMLYIYLTICISVRWSLQVSSLLTDHVKKTLWPLFIDAWGSTTSSHYEEAVYRRKKMKKLKKSCGTYTA